MLKTRLTSSILLILLLILALGITASTQPALAQTPESTPTPTPEIGIQPNLPKVLYPVPWSIAPHDHFFFNRPIAPTENYLPLPGYRYGGVFFAADQPHTGVDFGVDEGTETHAAADGQVIWAGYGLLYGYEDEEDPYGLAIAIEHEFGYQNKRLYTLYAHLSELLVVKGQRVKSGDLIALSGNTGFTTAPHLHFEVRLGTNNFYNTYNPELWMAPFQGRGVLTGKVTDNVGNLLLDHPVHLRNLSTEEEYSLTTYGNDQAINPDMYFRENFAVSDLPAGQYELTITFELYYYRTTVTVYPGTTVYFRYQGHWGYIDTPPPIKAPGNLPISEETQP
jgi:murein DD-endopeptidase MepM/ murein hydrolase activator NlpD